MEPEELTLRALADEIRAIWDDAAKEQEKRQKAEASGLTKSSRSSPSRSSPAVHRHTLLLVDCGPRMMRRAEEAMAKASDASSGVGEDLAAAKNEGPPPRHEPRPPRRLLPESCGFMRALKGCEAVVKAHVRGVAFGGGARSDARGRSLQDAVGIVLYNTRVREPVPSWDRHRPPNPVRDGDGAAPTAARATPPKDDGDDASHEEEEEEEEEEEAYEDNDPDADFLAFKTAASRTHDFVPLDVPGGSTVHRIRDALRGTIDLADLYGHVVAPHPSTTTQESSFSSSSIEEMHGHLDEAMIATASTIRAHLREHKHKGDEAHVWVFTNHPDPCRSDAVAALRSSVRDSMRMCRGSVTVWPMDDDPLDLYRRLDDGDGDNNYLRVMACTDSDDDLHEYLCQEWARPSAVARPKWRSIPLIRPDWRQTCCGNDDPPPSGIMLDWFDIVAAKATMPTEKEVDAFTGIPVSSETHYLAGGGGPILAVKSGTKATCGVPPDRMFTYAVLKDLRVPVSPMDRLRVQKASCSCPYASLILWGFKDANEVPFYMNMDKPFFVLPSAGEENSNGALAFAGLRDSMTRKGVVMIGELVPRAGSISRLVALSPWEPIPGVAIQPPPGMLARLLPFKEELRDTAPPPADIGESSEVPGVLLVTAMKELVAKLTYVGEDTPVIGEDFTNARLDRLQNYIERVAMNDPEPPDGGEVDYDTSVTELTKEKRRAKLSDLIASLKDAIPKKESLSEKVASPKGRKRNRVDEEDTEEDSSDWISRYVAFDYDINKFKVSELKAYCKEVGMVQSGTRGVVGPRVKAHIEACITANRMGE